MDGLIMGDNGFWDTPVLEINDLTVEYVTRFHRTPAVRNLSLSIQEQQVYGLVGESGCGKSTAALACMRYLPPGTRLEGKVELLGQDMLTVGSRQLRQLRGNRIAMVYQDPLQALNPSMSVIRQMEEILTVNRYFLKDLDENIIKKKFKESKIDVESRKYLRQIDNLNEKELLWMCLNSEEELVKLYQKAISFYQLQKPEDQLFKKQLYTSLSHFNQMKMIRESLHYRDN